MKFFINLGLLLCLTSVSLCTKDTEKKTTSEESFKPKREASLPSSKSSFSGPSYKYLPPSPTASFGSGYDSNYNHGSLSGYDYSSSSGDSSHYHHGSSGNDISSYHGHHGIDHSYHYPNHNYDNHHDHHHSFGNAGSGGYTYQSGRDFATNHIPEHFGHSSGGGYRYTSPFAKGFSSSHDFSSGSDYKHKDYQSYSHGPEQNIRSFSSPSGYANPGSGGYNYYRGNSGHGGYVSSFDHGNSGSSIGLSGSGSFGHSSTDYDGPYAPSHYNGGGSSIHQSSGYNYAPGISGSIAPTGSYSNRPSSFESSKQGSSTSTYGSGYSYEAPSVSYGSNVPSTSYGVPNNGYSSSGFARETPAYAAGHKGLGYFGYSVHKPQVLNTNIIGSNKFNAPQFSKAPFKPSTFLGASHETPNSAYIPPSSNGYDYQPPSIPFNTRELLPAPKTPSIDLATPIHEPSASYLPPHN